MTLAARTGISLVALLTFSLGIGSQKQLTPKQIFEKHSGAVVKVVTDTGEGTGFFIKNGLTVSTCYHVIKKAKRIEVRGTKNKVWKVSAVTIDPPNDAAILKLSADSGRTPIPIGDFSKLRPGDALSVIGHPLGLQQSITTGIVSARVKEGATSIVQMTAAISPGSSGSPVLDGQGKAAAFAVGTFTEGQALNLAVSISHVTNLFSKTAVKAADFFASEAKKPADPSSESGSGDVARIQKTRVTMAALEDIGKRLSILDRLYHSELLKGTDAKTIESQLDDYGAKLAEFLKQTAERRIWRAGTDSFFIDDMSELASVLGTTITTMKREIPYFRPLGRVGNKDSWTSVLKAIDELHYKYATLRLNMALAPWIEFDTYIDETNRAIDYNYMKTTLVDIQADDRDEFRDKARIALSWSNQPYAGCNIVGLKRSWDEQFQPVANWDDVLVLLTDCEDETISIKYAGVRSGVATLDHYPFEGVISRRVRPIPVVKSPAQSTGPKTGG